MISYNCLNLCLKENGLLQLASQSIVQIESEISYINTLLQDSPSLQLTSQDLDYYKEELASVLYSNTELLWYISSCMNSIYDLIFMAKQ